MSHPSPISHEHNARDKNQEPAAPGYEWEEREYNGTMRVSDDDIWLTKVGKQVPKFDNQDKWVRNVRRLEYA